MRALKPFTLAVILFAPFGLGTGLRAQSRSLSAPAFKVIVNPRNPVNRMERRLLADAFLKKITRWSNGELIRPIDLDADSPARRSFSEEVLDRSVPATKSYWQQLIFSGRDVPPPEFDSDAQVIAYVQKNVGAVGYVSGSTNVGGVKLVTVQ